MAVPRRVAPRRERVTEDELTTATDIYGFGGMLYALLTGSSPFRGETLQETRARNLPCLLARRIRKSMEIWKHASKIS